MLKGDTGYENIDVIDRFSLFPGGSIDISRYGG